MNAGDDDDYDDDPSTDPFTIEWKIGRAGRAWAGDEVDERLELRPEKLEMWEGKLLWSDNERLLLIGLLLENVGVDRVARLGDPDVWRNAVAGL